MATERDLRKEWEEFKKGLEKENSGIFSHESDALKYCTPKSQNPPPPPKKQGKGHIINSGCAEHCNWPYCTYDDCAADAQAGLKPFPVSQPIPDFAPGGPVPKGGQEVRLKRDREELDREWDELAKLATGQRMPKYSTDYPRLGVFEWSSFWIGFFTGMASLIAGSVLVTWLFWS